MCARACVLFGLCVLVYVYVCVGLRCLFCVWLYVVVVAGCVCVYVGVVCCVGLVCCALLWCVLSCVVVA